MAKLEEAETTEKMILALSSLIPLQFKDTRTVRSAAKELKVVADYMYLQRCASGSGPVMN